MLLFIAKLREIGRVRLRPGAVRAEVPQVKEGATSLTNEQTQLGQRLMVQEGSLWSFMNSITAAGGIVTTAFALYLHADAFAIALLSSLPLIAALTQLWTPQLVNKLGSRKQVCVVTLGTARFLIIPLVLLALGAWFMPELSAVWLVLFLGMISLGAAFTAIGGTAWLSWASTMIPPEKRAIYFARRNTIIGVIGLAVSLFLGFFMDWWTEPTPTGHRTHPAAYVVLFLVAALFGIATIFTLRRTPDLRVPRNAPRPRFRDSLTATWNHLPMRKYLAFRTAWLFAVGVAVPYYTVYMLKNLSMSFTEVFILTNIGAMAGLLGTPLWGRIIEKHGYSRIMYWTSWIKTVYVGLWAFVTPGQPFWSLAFLHATLFVDAGLNLCSSNMLMNLMPDHGAGNVGYYSVFTAVTSLVSATGPFLAGVLVGLVAGGSLEMFGMAFGAIQLMFLLSAVLRALAMAFFRDFGIS